MLARGDWVELGKVSCPEIDRLVEAALGAGAYGVKISGSGGGGIIIALVAPDTQSAVVDTIHAASGTALTPLIGVKGVTIEIK